MSRILVPTRDADDWQGLLAKPELHWQEGFSARTLAHSWEAAQGLPPEIATMFRAEPSLGGADPELLLALPEWKVPLPGGRRESQNDVFALIRAGTGTIALMVEGKVSEPFGPTIGEWLVEASDGKAVRLRAIQDLLGLAGDIPPGTRYQLLHRTASALIEARRFGATAAAMVVQSFSTERLWFDDFLAFARLLGTEPTPDRLVHARSTTAVPLYIGWATGDARFLRA